MTVTYLTDDQLADFKQQLLNMKNNIEQKLDTDESREARVSNDELSDFQNHPADQGTEQFEQELDEGFTLIEKDQLIDIQDALRKINNGTYGLSEVSQKPIPLERLKAEPTARIRVDEE